MHQITISVHKKDLEKGKPCEGTKCAIALAARREIPKEYSIEVLPRKLRLLQKCGRGFREFPLPPEVALFLERFDRNLPVDPFSFSIFIEYPTPKDTGTAFSARIRTTEYFGAKGEPSTVQILAATKELFGK